MSDPCAMTNAIGVIHYLILSGVGVQLVIGWFQVRLMWKDYKKRHKINGSDS